MSWAVPDHPPDAPRDAWTAGLLAASSGAARAESEAAWRGGLKDAPMGAWSGGWTGVRRCGAAC